MNSTDDLVKSITVAIIEALKKHPAKNREQLKDALTEVTTALTSNNDTSTSAGSPTRPPGTVIAADGTVVTLGLNNGQDVSSVSPSRDTNLPVSRPL